MSYILTERGRRPLILEAKTIMDRFKTTISTDGRGLWSEVVKRVKIEKLQLRYVDNDFGELKVFFDPKTWDVKDDGLIYTDQRFIKELKNVLKTQYDLSLSALKKLEYSEQGMQGRNYVSFDVEGKFMREFENAIS